jgi:hypothetical protein
LPEACLGGVKVKVKDPAVLTCAKAVAEKSVIRAITAILSKFFFIFLVFNICNSLITSISFNTLL